MRRIFTSFCLSLLCISVSAQEALDYSVIAEVFFSKEFSLSDFIIKYKDYIIEYDDSADGEIILKDIELNGYKSTAHFYYSDYADGKIKLLAVMPEYSSFSKDDQYLYATKCHSHMLDKFGAPDKTEEGSPDLPSIIEETIYTWHRENGIVITGTLSKTKYFDLYMITVFNLPTTAIVQRHFFKTLELGKVTSKEQIVLALGANTFHLHTTNQSSGTSYTYTKPIYFGGIEWTMTDLDTVENALSSIRFTHISQYDNRGIFRRISSALTQKYGTPKVDNNYEQGWFDHKTLVTLEYQYGLSKSGEMKHYVYLKYFDDELHNKASEIIQSEL